MKAKPITLTADEVTVIERLREFKLAGWTDAAVPGAHRIYDEALEALTDAINAYAKVK